MEKVQTTIPTTYYDEKRMFAEIRWALICLRCFPIAKLLQVWGQKQTEMYDKPWTCPLF